MRIVSSSRPAVLKVFPELGRESVARGFSLAYRLWLILRSLDEAGRGTVSKARLYAFLPTVGLSQRHYRTAHHSAGAALFWRDEGDYIRLAGLESICLALGVEPGRPMQIDLLSVGSVEAFRAALYDAWLSTDPRGQRISRELLCGLWGVTENTLRAWEGRAGIQVDPQTVHVPDHLRDLADRVAPRDKRDQHLDEIHYFERDGQIYYRTVNRYQGNAEKARRGRSRKVAAIVKRSVKSGYECAAGAKRKVFYDTAINGADQRTPAPAGCIWVTGDVLTTYPRHGADQPRTAAHSLLCELSDQRPTGARNVQQND